MYRSLPLTALLVLAPLATAQSSSLYLEPEARAQRNDIVRPEPVARLSPAVARWSLTAVPVPEPKQYQVHDLVTIIVREATENQWDAEIETGKQTGFNGSLSAIPKFELAQFMLSPDGVTNPLEAKFDWKNDFEGEGKHARAETITGRIQAKIIDVKPNGVIALEARKFNQVDDETLTMTLTGMCRAEDITADNTVLSSQMYDLHLQKTHTGELRKTTKKGLFTKIFEGLFNF